MKILNQEKIVIEKNHFQPSLEIMPLSLFEERADLFRSQLNIYKKEHARLLEYFFANFLILESDKQVIYLPSDFYNHLELNGKNELVLTGMHKSFMISAGHDWEERHQKDQALFTEYLRKRKYE